MRRVHKNRFSFEPSLLSYILGSGDRAKGRKEEEERKKDHLLMFADERIRKSAEMLSRKKDAILGNLLATGIF